jgi:predicted permease
MNSLFRRIRFVVQQRKFERELAEEIEFHRGMLEKEAGAEAARALGPATLMREDARAVWIWPWLESVVQDLAYAARGFRRQPGFALVAIFALACAIGLNTSLFTVFNAVALRPLPVKEPARLVRAYSWTKNPPRGMDNAGGFSLEEFRYLAAHSKSMAGFFVTRQDGAHLENAPVHVEYATGDFFRVLGIEMERGRGFIEEEDRLASPQPVVVLSHAVWQNRFGSDPAIVGRNVHIGEVPFTVIGVAPPEFEGSSPEKTEVWLPLSSALLASDAGWSPSLRREKTCCFEMSGRLAPGIKRSQAAAELSVLSIEYRRQNRDTGDGVVLTGTPPLQKPGRKTGQITAVFVLMFAAVILVLLLACANVGNLLLARAAARRREIGARLSLGASRGRIVRQLLTESLALASCAAALGISLAYLLPGPMFTSVAGAASFRLTPDATVLAYTAGLAMLACLAFGLAPALQATRGSLSEALQARGADGRHRLRGFLLAVQVSLSVVLLAGAGLLTRGIQHARLLDPGFSVQDIGYASFDFPAGATGPRLHAFFQSLDRGLQSVPGFGPFGFAYIEPFSNNRAFTGFRFPGQDEKQTVVVPGNQVSSGYFEALRIRVVAGRAFEPADTARNVVMINQAGADRFFGGDAVGKTLLNGGAKQIVGVVANARTIGLDDVDPTLYTPLASDSTPHLIFHNTPANIAAIQSLARGLDPKVQVRPVPLSENLDRWLAGARMGALIAGMLGVFALALAAIGIAGVFAYAVQQRTREIGIRVALGARPPQVVATVFRSAAVSLLGGLAAGLALALPGSAVIRQYLFGLNRLDPLTYAGVVLTLVIAALAATWLPLRRALRLDPTQALRQE